MLVIALQLATGLRPGEARTLQWGRVDLDAKTLHIDRAHTKTPNSIRTLHLADTALVVLRAAANRAQLAVRHPDAYVFPGLVRSAFVDESTLAAKLDTKAKALGIKVNDDAPRLPNPHEMRHTFASHLLEAGESSRKVARMLGDTVLTVERTYAHILSPVAGDEAAAVHVDSLLSVVKVAS
jgi:integrase